MPGNENQRATATAAVNYAGAGTAAAEDVERTSTEVHVVLPGVSSICALALVVWLWSPLKDLAAVVVSVLPLAADATVNLERQHHLCVEDTVQQRQELKTTKLCARGICCCSNASVPQLLLAIAILLHQQLHSTSVLVMLWFCQHRATIPSGCVQSAGLQEVRPDS